MKKAARKIFYAGLIRFQLFLLVLTVFPLLAIKLFLIFSPASLHAVLNILIIVALSASIVGSCVYVLMHYFTVDKTLKPIQRMAEVGELAARVAHDLRGPLSGIKTVLEQFHQLEWKDQKWANHLNLLELSTRRLENVAQDLLRKHKGEDEIQTHFNLHAVLDELIGEYAGQQILAGIRFSKKYTSEPIAIKGRRNKVERMLGNIIKNAMEAMGFEGDITITTKMREGKAMVFIQDIGPGLKPEQIEKIYSGSFTGGKKEGYGIGLTFVKEVLSDHGGSLTIESQPGFGACFQLELPVTEEKPEVFAVEALEGQPILIMDDDPSVLEQWRFKLSEKGMETIVAASYEDFAAKHISAGVGQTAIIDYHFENSELNGLEVIEKLKRMGWRHLYLCTGEYWKPSLKKEAEKLGVKVCPKPLPKIVVANRGDGVIASPEGTKQSPTESTGDCFASARNDNLCASRNDKEGGYAVLVIDDEPSIRMAWEIIQEKLHIEKLYCFPNLEMLLETRLDLRTIDIAFVDKNIKDSGYGGAEVVTYLRQSGVVKVVLASGESESELRQDPNLAQVDFIVNQKIPSSFKEFFS